MLLTPSLGVMLDGTNRIHDSYIIDAALWERFVDGLFGRPPADLDVPSCIAERPFSYDLETPTGRRRTR